MTAIDQNTIKQIVIKNGADLFGIAPIDRFDDAPEGFHPTDIYQKTKSVIVFAKRIPSETLYAESCVPFTHINTLAMQAVDLMTFHISSELEMIGIKNVIIPTDDPYEYWDEENKTGRAILSLRHTGYLAGLGIIGRNNLLVNEQFGNMIQIGALLTDSEIEPTPLAGYKTCPDNCRICIDTCPAKALDGTTINQKLCRPLSNYRNEKGYVLKKCYHCRKNCPLTLGLKNRKQNT
ncbi:MAG: epoxyqueuosine reductase [Bacteroidetes bacterium HGW-Bacteroidetes-6]|jgi:epoxyqueuosine reductase QueG|nr:MAG: epoxyqueuosine reductase [Bacteroidetes bacterium HGW-Bacteroidetes-6]